MNETLYKVSWSKDGSLSRAEQSESMPTLFYAQQLATEKARSNKSVTILKASTVGINAGKFFLDLIIK